MDRPDMLSWMSVWPGSADTRRRTAVSWALPHSKRISGSPELSSSNARSA